MFMQRSLRREASVGELVAEGEDEEAVDLRHLLDQLRGRLAHPVAGLRVHPGHQGVRLKSNFKNFMNFGKH